MAQDFTNNGGVAYGTLLLFHQEFMMVSGTVIYGLLK